MEKLLLESSHTIEDIPTNIHVKKYIWNEEINIYSYKNQILLIIIDHYHNNGYSRIKNNIFSKSGSKIVIPNIDSHDDIFNEFIVRWNSNFPDKIMNFITRKYTRDYFQPFYN